ncbi:MAG: anti-sigma factor family protein [Planctomycetota bacterium]|jgi:hypothetical protein
MECKKFEDLISEGLDGRLDESLRREFEAHESQCGSCSRVLAASVREERAARKTTAIVARSDFEDKVLTRVDSVPPTVQEGLSTRPGPARFRMITGIAAGLVVGLTLGVLGHRILMPSPGPAEGEAAAEPDLANTKMKRPSADVDRARGDAANFFKASENLATDIHSLPWNDHYADAKTLDKIVNALEMEKRLKEAEQASPVLKKLSPDCSLAMEELINDQRFIVDQVSAHEAFRPDIVAEVKAKASNTFDNVKRIREGLNIGQPVSVLWDPGKKGAASFTIHLGSERAIDYLAQASRHELAGDLQSALIICEKFSKKFPDSHLKLLAELRKARIWKTVGREDMVIQVFDALPRILEQGELLENQQVQIEGILRQISKCDPKKLSKIRKKVGSLVMKPSLFSHILAVKLNEAVIPMTRHKQHHAWVLYNRLTHDGWTMPQQKIRVDSDGARSVQIVFEKRGKIGKPVTQAMNWLMRGSEKQEDPEKVTRIAFLCR